MSLEQQQELESTYVMHTFARKPVELVSGKGMEVVDATGKTYVDFLSGIGVISLGHCNPVLVEALQKQTETLMHVSNYYYIEGRGELAQTLSDLLNERVLPSEASPWESFFANSGAEANECAIKLARLYAKTQAKKRVLAQGGDDAAAHDAMLAAPQVIVTLDKSFHGRTLATLAATAQPGKQEAFQPLPAGFISTPANDISALQELFASRGNEICAVMVECIQGESGVHPCSPQFLAEIRRLTQETGALFICDEVQCGIYRCGNYPFGFQHFDVMPDVVTIAKGIGSGFPMGICAARQEVAQVFEPGDHGTTFGGSCLAITAARTVLDYIKTHELAARVHEVGVYLRSQLECLDGVVEVRGLGLMVGADLAQDISAPDVVSKGLEAGLLLNAPGPHTLRFLPPLVCTKADVDTLIARLKAILSA
ncbi:aspartate aminotransferase family protein [Eggerthellaceae bacterium 3-80]|nr:aspartate aminotransferase family protein [bacterium D16-34]